MHPSHTRVLTAFLLSLALVACASRPQRAPSTPPVPVVPASPYERASWSELPGWQSDPLHEAWPALLSSCRALRFRAEWSVPCTAAQGVTGATADEVRRFFEQYFEPYKVVKYTGTVREDTGLVTGYYEPQLLGARTPSAQFRTPLYAPPPDLLTIDLASVYPELKGMRLRGRLEGNRVVPYYSRAELANNPAVRGHEIVWVDNELDAFMLQVQGSGRVLLPTGEVIRLQYMDQNGHPYRSIGRYLVDNEFLKTEEATMPGIRAWLASHPEQLQNVLNANPSVVFFREEPIADPAQGPKGAQGIPLTPGRSIAVDPAFVPLGTPVFLATTFPASALPLQRLVIAQDTGGAIKGAARADLFWGTGPGAGELAGKMRQPGSMWILWPRNVPLPR